MRRGYDCVMGDKRTFLLMSEDLDSLMHIEGAYASLGVAKLWQAQRMAEMIEEMALGGEAGKDLRQLLLDGRVDAAQILFEDLCGERMWVEEKEVRSEAPLVGAVRRGF